MVPISNAQNMIFPLVSSIDSGARLKIRAPFALVLLKKDGFWGFKDLKKTVTRSVILCKASSSESDLELILEREILEFMKISKNPNDFPTKTELLDAGKIDLVNAIIKKGGWLSLGWDDSDDENECDEKEFDDINNEIDHSCNSCHQLASPADKSLETVVQLDAGIEGILHRLEKHRSLYFGIKDVGVENYCGEKLNKEENKDSKDKLLPTQKNPELDEINKKIDSNYIKSRLQKMQLELSSSLCLLRSKSETNNPDGHKTMSLELQQLSDKSEFQENEIINAKNRLRSISAQLAVVQGNMSLSVIKAQKLLEAKQKRIDSGFKTLQILHTTCIIWANSASEVLLAGSFDGWTTQRKMERSETGGFSLSLKLYPGRYEIKFIVDGVWRVDLLRPIINNNGYENNVLIIHE